MALAYLLDPNLQIQNQAGVNNVAGFIRVFMNGTDDRAVTYSDFTGTLNPADIPLDNNGRCVIIADSEGVYRVEVYNRNGGLCWTQYPLTTMAGGGGAAPVVALESSDGSIGITRTSSGGKVTYDLAVASGDPNYTEWAKCSGANTPSPGIMIPLKAGGNMDITADGITLKADNLYHITARFAATKTETSPYYDNITVSFNTYDGEHTSTEVSSGRIVDYSMGLEQEFEISADIKVGTRDESLYFSYAGQDVAGGAIRFRTADIHMLNSGVPRIPGGMATREWVSENYQEKLTAGEGITIEDNVISADASQQVQSDWTEQDTSSPAYIQNKPSLATVATSGSYNDLTDKPDIPSQQVQSDWAEQDTSSPAYIQNKPDMDSYATDQELTAGLATKQDVIQDIAAIRAGAQQGATAVQPSDLASALDPYATKQEVVQDLSTKQNTIDDLTQIRQGASLGATALQPGALDPYATKQEVTTGLAGKQDTISDLASIRSGAAEGATAVQPSDLAAVATSGSYNDLSDKPSIPAPVTVDQHYSASSTNAQSGTAVAEALDAFDALPASTPQDAGKVLRVDTNGDAEWATNVAPQVQSDWAQTDAAAVDYIKNKPNLAAVATSGSYNDLSDRPSIPAAQVQSDWNESDNTQVDYIKNKPDLSGFATQTELTQGLAGKQDTISDLATIRSGAAEGATAVQPSDLATVATSGSYNDLSDKPSIPAAQVNSDWNASSGAAEILNKPQLSTVATTGDYNDLSNKPSIPAAQVNSDWNASSGIAQILNKPSLATVATSGSYSDLSNTPTIPTATSDLNNDSGFITLSDVPAQVNSDWNASSGVAEILNKPANLVQDASYVHTDNNFTTAEKDKLAGVQAGAEVNVQPDWSQSDSTADDYIKNKPNLAAVATSGDYVDLSNKPTIPAAQVNSDWSANSGVAQILNKPNLAAVATSGDYGDLSNTPTIPAAQVQSNWTESDTSSKAYIQNKPTLAAVATSGSYTDLSNTPTIPVVPAMKDLVAGNNVTITEDNNSVTISAGGGPVDQAYDATSPNAQSGVAVASALGGKEDDFDAGEGLEFTTDGQGNRVLQVEGPVDIVAGPGIVIDNPDGNTLRVSQQHPTDETVLWTVPSGSENTNNYSIVLSETIHNFEEIAVYCKCTRIENSLQVTTKNVYPVCDSGYTMFADGVSTNHWNITAGQNAHYTCGVDVRLTGATGYIGENYRWGIQNGTSVWEVQRVSDNGIYPHPYKIVGIKRVASN